MDENIEILQNPFIGGSLVHVRVLEILDQNSKKNFAGCNGLTYTFRAIHFYANINNCERSFMTIHI